jgi:hypothetical protein
MDPSGSQQNSSGGNVIVLNNNDLMQQRTSLGNGQQVFIAKKDFLLIFHPMFLQRIINNDQIKRVSRG